ncbi:MAG: hypothetical protein IJW05_12485 [Lentisphaeria bacterium]|nr:hypothetical protein [Lentisphaeria bacterium]
MEIWAKIENETVIYPPRNDKSKGMFNVDKNEKWLTENGFQLYDTAELQKYQPTIEEEPKKYSTLKIIRNLGDEWEGYREQLSEAGVLDQFFAANYLAEDDPVFLAFLETVPEEVKAKLILCEWED